ncbi:uroporphyrinogen-III synthase [Halopenitus persicus]|uniref:Uroporphyrinogen-III synthase n=1 Tax=Halopenitus persicus TaxID=1048396 RepID=A0A1H3LY08_9EURY|nr:uroporphyrinogen-III synthase [Halopenitus persicus]SDY69321.1 uroporphyrinogen-III synthase [Halopenitus persicus]
MSRQVRVAVFRPDDDRIEDAVELLESLGADPVPDPMLAVKPTGETPADAPYVVLTSKTGVELAAERGWVPAAETTLVAIGPATAAAAREAGWTVDLIPEEYTSAGLVDLLADRIAEGPEGDEGDEGTEGAEGGKGAEGTANGGVAIEVARSDHGSAVLTEGLAAAGADVHETVLYRLVRPEEAGRSTELAAAGELEAAAFTSSLTVEHFLEAAAERGVEDAARAGLADAVVGTIGDPTRETAEAHGIDVDVVPAEATFESLATAVVEHAAPSHRGE